MSNLFIIFIIVITFFVNVAYLTLLERKILGAFQRRRGPNVVGIFGLLQPFADGLKLLVKELLIPIRSNIFIFLIGPLVSLILSLVIWVVIPFGYGIVLSDLRIGILYIFAISSLNVYGVLMSGWSSNSKYAFFGSLRSSAQMISYEVSIGLILLIIILVSNSFNITTIVFVQISIWNIFLISPCFVLFFISILAETNRTPFDLSEAEGELVAGFNVEYAGVGFALFFISEYLNMILMSILMSLLFLGGWLALIFKLWGSIWFSLKLVFFMFLFIWVRGSLPRYRYNQLMILGWKVILPVSFSLLIIYFGIELLLNIFILW